jgi:hypothetical protein
MILLAAITRRVEPRTPKFKGSIKSKNITILVDSRSTHNFVDINLAKQLNLFVYSCEGSHGYNCADGQQVEGLGWCHKVYVQIQNLELQTGYYALPLSGMDMVLGIMVDTIGNLCHKPPRTIYGVQMAREELQVIWFRSQNIPLKELTNLTLPLRTSLPNIQKQIQNQDESPQGKTIHLGLL